MAPIRLEPHSHKGIFQHKKNEDRYCIEFEYGLQF